MNCSEQMARIRGNDTGPEVALRKALWNVGLRYRVNYRTPSGRADIAFVFRKGAVFVDGYFWHGSPKHYSSPRTATPYWSGKLGRNVERDRRQTLALEEAGWRVVRVWEQEMLSEMGSVIGRGRDALDADCARALDWRAVEVTSVTDDGMWERWVLEPLRDPVTQREQVRERSRSGWPRTGIARMMEDRVSARSPEGRDAS